MGGDLKVGDKVEANYQGRGKWLPGEIKLVRTDGSYDVDYDSGEVETAVGAELVRAASSTGDILEPNLEQEEEINALKIQAEANAKIIAELESLLAAYRQPPVQPDNSGTLTFANIRFSSSQLLLSSSSPDGSKSRSEEKLGEQTLSNQLSLARFTEAASVESANAAYTTVVQYPMGLVDGLSPALHQRQSPLRLSDPTATDTLSIGDDNESNRGVIRLLAMPEEELQAVIEIVNQQLRHFDDLVTAQKSLCAALTAELETLKAANRNAQNDAQSRIESLRTELETELDNNSKRERLIQRLQDELQQLKSAASAQSAQKSLEEVRVFNNGSEFRVENASAATSFFFCDFDMDFAKLEGATDVIAEGNFLSLKRKSSSSTSSINLKAGLSASDELMLESVLSTKEVPHHGTSIGTAGGSDQYLAISRSDMLSFVNELNNRLQLSLDAVKKLEEKAESTNKLLDAETKLNASLSAALGNAVDLASIDDFGMKLSPIAELGDNQFGAAALSLAHLNFKKLIFQSDSATTSSPSSLMDLSNNNIPKQLSTLNEVCSLISAHKMATTNGGTARRKSRTGALMDDSSFYCFQEKSFISMMELVNKYLLELDLTSRLYEEEKRRISDLDDELEATRFELEACKACAEQYLLELKAKSSLHAECDGYLKKEKMENQLLREKIQALDNQFVECKSTLLDAIAEINRQKAAAIDVDNSGVVFKVSNSKEAVQFSFQRISFHDSLLSSSSDARRSNYFQLSNSLGPFPTIQSKRSNSSATEGKLDAKGHKYIALNEQELNDAVNHIVIKWRELIAAKDRYIHGITAQNDASTAAAAKMESDFTQRLRELADKLENANSQVDNLTATNNKLSRDSTIQIKDLMDKLKLSQNQCESVLLEVKKLNTRLNKLKDKFSINKLVLEPVQDVLTRTEVLSKVSLTNQSRRTSGVDALQYEVLSLTPVIDERVLSNDEVSPAKYCAIEESELVGIIEALNKRLGDFISLHSSDLNKVMVKSKNVEDLKGEIKKLQHTLNEALRQNELLRSVKVENVGSALSVLSSREAVTFSFYHLVRDGAHSPGEVKMGQHFGADSSAIAYALERMNGPVTSIGLVVEDRSMAPSGSSSSSSSSDPLGKQPGKAVTSESSYTSPSNPKYKVGSLKGRNSSSGSSNNATTFSHEDKLTLSFAAIDKSEISRFLDSINRILHEYDAALAEKSYEVALKLRYCIRVCTIYRCIYLSYYR